MSTGAIDRIERNLVAIGDGASAGSATIHERMAFHGARAVSLAVIDNYEIVVARAYSTVEDAAAIDSSTLFQAASISKPVAALAVLKLVEEKRLDLDEPVNDRLSSWKIPANEFTRVCEVTARHLLSHTAATTVHGFPGYAPHERIPTLRQILDGLPPANTDAVRVDAVPGSLWRYSGGGFTVLQQLLEEFSGTSFPVLMRDIVLGPLGMRDSTFEQPLPERLRGRAAPGGLASGEMLPGRFHTYPEMAAAGLWTTPSDLANFAIELQLARLGRSDRVLSRAVCDLMLTPQTALPADLGGGYLGSHMGPGIFLDVEQESPRFGHAGENAGYMSYLIADLSGHGAAIMTSSEAGGLIEEIIAAIAREFAWPVSRPPNSR